MARNKLQNLKPSFVARAFDFFRALSFDIFKISKFFKIHNKSHDNFSFRKISIFLHILYFLNFLIIKSPANKKLSYIKYAINKTFVNNFY